MKVKLIYKKGIEYSDLPDDWHNRDRINIPRKEYPCAVVRSTDALTHPQFDDYHVFQHEGFETIGDDLFKVLKEI